MDWLMFKDGDRETPGDWEKSAMDSLGTASPDLAGIELRLPSADDAAFALSNNLDMTGSIAFSFTDGDRRQFEILLPYHGVFVTRGTDAERRNSPQRMVWSSWFGEMPGLRRVRSPNGKKSLRLGLPDGRFIAIDEKRGSLGDIPFVLWWAGFNKDAYGEDLLDILALYKKAKGEKQFAALCDDVAKWAMENGVPETDADDIGHRMAVTFPVWLRNRLQRLCHGFLVARKGSRESWKDMARALVPATAAGRQRFTCFDVIHPDNILEAAGRICGIRRFHLGRKTIGFMPAEFRQNHPSFEGRICPIESPESEMVGIQLQLARGASVDVDGRIVPSKGQPPYVSWCTSLIPFLHHNDDARSMMGAKNLRQGVPVSGAEPPCVKSGGEAGIVEFMRPLESAGLCPRCSDDGELKIGRDLLVAYLPWYGWNLDDAVVVSDDVVKKMAVTEEKDHAIDIMPEWRCTQVLQEGGILREGTVIAEFKEERGGKDHVHSIKYVDAAPARLLRIDCPSEIMKAPGDRVPGLVCRLRYRIAREFVLEPGDKLMGRHGNKGVVSMVLPKSEMPRLPDGTTVDILLNPHGVLSRMNPGQLLETHLGWLFHKGKTDADVLAKDAAGPAGCPCRGAVDHEKVKRLLKETGLDEFGKTRLRWTLPNGRKVTTASSVVVGYQHFFRLHHIPALKAQARRGGADAMYSCATGQAAHGRLIGGGQRVGEMEMWALSAYPGTEPIIADLLRNSDAVAVKGDVAPEFGQTGFWQVFSDYLAAMLIKMEVDKKRMTVSFSRMTDEDVLRRAGEKGTITKASSASVRSAQYRCPTHADRLAFGGIRFKWSGKDRRTTLSLASMLSSSGISVKSPLRKVDNGTYRMDICGAKTDHLEARPLWAKKREAATTLSLEVNTSALGVKGVGDIRCYFKRTARAGEVLRRLCLPASDKLAESIGDARVLCPCEDCAKSKPQEQLLLQAADTQGEMSEGGVCDPEKFGTLREAFVPAGEEKWGVIVLPIPVGHIADETSGQPKLSCVPVPPLRYRVGYEGNADPFGYGNIVSACERYCKAKVGADEAKGEAVTAKAKKVSAAAKSIETAVRATFGALLREFTGKYGLVRRDGLGRRVDRSCRMVITPGPDLAFDEVGVPAAVLWELMADRIVDERVKIDGKGQSVDKRATAHGVTAAGFGWRSPKESSEKRLAEKEVILKSYLEAYPHWMLLNRQPSLHKHSMQAFRVKVLGPRDGEVFRLQPLSCKGFGADFDGDEMAGYLPLSATAQKALPGLAPSRNLFAAGDGQPTPNFDRDFVMGAYLLSGRDSAAAKEDLERLCRKGDAKAVLKCARDAFARCTEEGVSFGYYDLAAYDGKNGFVADMVRSRANGAGQIRQFVKARGRLETGALGFVPTGDVEAMFDIRSSLVEGMAWEDIFWSSFNARASMCDKKLNTAKAGDLTRRLVYALRPLTISCSKCGCPDGKRSVLACRCKDGLCAECYGTLPDGTKPKRGYPAGLVAAQSIGERGTQLSMKSAHVGRSQIDIDSVRRLILDGGSDKVKRYRDFLKRLPEPYHSLDERHLQLLWRVLKEVEGTSLQGALDAVDGRKDMESVARRANMDTIASFLLGEVRDVSIDTPSARVMFANFKEEK